MKIITATSLLLCISSGLANQCTDKCNTVFSRSITQILTSCVDACQSGGQVCDDFCKDYVSDVETCKEIFCQDRRLGKKTNLRSSGER
eukprot:scaffold57386_cov66-Cyclotella_meneghiniana.AAC.14